MPVKTLMHASAYGAATYSGLDPHFENDPAGYAQQWVDACTRLGYDLMVVRPAGARPGILHAGCWHVIPERQREWWRHASVRCGPYIGFSLPPDWWMRMGSIQCAWAEPRQITSRSLDERVAWACAEIVPMLELCPDVSLIGLDGASHVIVRPDGTRDTTERDQAAAVADMLRRLFPGRGLRVIGDGLPTRPGLIPGMEVIDPDAPRSLEWTGEFSTALRLGLQYSRVPADMTCWIAVYRHERIDDPIFIYWREQFLLMGYRLAPGSGWTDDECRRITG